MALFSKEYLIKNQIDLPADFSIQEIFAEMEVNSTFEIICEGFGIVQIINRKNNCYLRLINGIEVTNETILSENQA